MNPKPFRLPVSLLILIAGIISFESCTMPEVKLREYMRPVRKLFNKERHFWTDKIEYKGKSGDEIVYYKNGRPALHRFYDEGGFLRQVVYLGREGLPIRTDSLVYADDHLIAGYYFSEPDHQLVLKFLNYSQQGQLSQRSWFDGQLQLLSREFFLFDLSGKRRMRMIFDQNDSLIYSETFRADSDELELQNTYTLGGKLKSQVRYSLVETPVAYTFNDAGQIISLSQLREDGSISWTNDFTYGREGTIIQSNFSTESRFLMSHMGDYEFYQQRARTWKHPGQPGQKLRIIKYDHHDPWDVVDEQGADSQIVTSFYFPRSRALFKRSVKDGNGVIRSDTLYGQEGSRQVLATIDYDIQGRVSQETINDLAAVPRWRKTWYRDESGRTIREEVTALPDTFTAAVTRVYDALGQSALSEKFQGGQFEGTWVHYEGGGILRTLRYDPEQILGEAWSFRPSGDTVKHSRYETIDFFTIESELGRSDTLLSHRRYTPDGLLNWKLSYDRNGQIVRETHHKRNGELYRETLYDPEQRTITSTTFAPHDPLLGPVDPTVRGEVSSHIVSKLNARGEVVQLVSRNTSGDVEWEKRYAYRKGRLVKSAQLDGRSKPVVISAYTHNKAGQVLTETAVDADKVEVHFVEHRYNEEGQLIWKSFRSDLTGLNNSNRYYYNEQGQMIRNEIIEDKHFVEAVEYTYYPQYYLRIATHMDPEGTLLRKEIENDFGDNVFDHIYQPPVEE